MTVVESPPETAKRQEHTENTEIPSDEIYSLFKISAGV